MKPSLSAAFISVTLCLASTSCHNGGTSDDDDTDAVWDSSHHTESHQSQLPEYSDLRMFELSGPVKECTKETFYSIRLLENDKVEVDSAPNKRHTAKLYFDKLGNYVPSADERVDRDDKGRIVYWRDRRPNAKGVDPGMLRDTLRYTHLNNNVLQSRGMGEFAVTVYDSENRIVGQYSDPDIEGTTMAAFNVYRSFDHRGNWTERMTVWTTQSRRGRPHVSYTLDSRVITYY